MASGFRKILNIEKEELAIVIVLLFQSIFLGIFAGTFDVSAQSYFLEIFSTDLIPRAFAYSGAVGIVITSIYSFLQSRLRFSVFSIINLLFVAILTLALRLGFEFFDSDHLVFAMFVLMGPLTIISFLGFWGNVSRMFSLRQGKRLFGLIDTGQIMGIIIASYSIPILLSFNFDILNSLYICSGSMIIALLIQIFISSRYNLKSQIEETQKTNKKRSNFFDLFRKKYTFLMVSFVILSVFAAFFIHYSFLVVTETNYPDPNALASFLGVFMGTVMVFSLIVKTFVYAKLMKTYGLKLALAIAPILLGIFVIGALIVGSIYGFTATSAGFTLFFLLIVSGKLFSKSFKDSVEVPSSKILYQSLDSDIRFDVQSRIDGTVNELAAFSSGILLAGLAMIASFKLIHFSYVLIGILVLWILVAFLLHRSYKVSLQEALIKYKQGGAMGKVKTSLNDKYLSESDQTKKLENILEFAPQTWDGFISKNLKFLLEGSKAVQRITLDWINKLNISESSELLISQEPESDKISQGILKNLIQRFKLSKNELSFSSIKKLAESDVVEDRLKALIIIANSKDNQSFSLLSFLVKDKDYGVCISSIRLVGEKNYLDLTPVLIDLLDHTIYYPFAFNALIPVADKILDKLDQAFYKSSSSEKLMLRIIRLMSLSESEEAIPFLLSKLEQTQSKIHFECFKALEKLGYIPDSQYEQRLIEYLYKLVGITAWDISIKQSLIEAKFSEELIKAFEEELALSYNHIFICLALLYDSQTVAQIKANIETGSSESIGYSIELLDLFVEESLKAILFAILEDTSDSIKIQNLQSEYPVEILKGEKILNAILNRDFNFLDSYTRILAIQEIGNLPEYEVNNDLVAHVFNPDLKVAENASRQIAILDKNILASVFLRLDPVKRDHLEACNKNIGIDVTQIRDDVFDILLNSPLGSSISRFQLFQLSRLFSMKELRINNEDDLKFLSNDSELFYFPQGTIKLGDKENQSSLIGGKHFYRLNDFRLKDKDHVKISIEDNISLLVLQEDKLKELIFDTGEEFFPVLENLMFSSDI